MLKRLLVIVAGFVGMHALAFADDFTLGDTSFTLPQGWTQADANETRQTYASPDGRQQATISLLHLSKTPSFGDFQLLCQHRYDAEKNGVKDLILIPQDPDPHNADGQFTMHYSGEENPTSRVFAGYLWIKGQELVIIYVEGIGIPSERNADSFHEIVKSLH
jgi:hypothetical protein